MKKPSSEDPLVPSEVNFIRSVARDANKPRGGWVEGLRADVRYANVCTPENVVRLCDEVDRLRAENARLDRLGRMALQEARGRGFESGQQLAVAAIAFNRALRRRRILRWLTFGIFGRESR